MSNAMENARYLREALLATGKVREGGREGGRERCKRSGSYSYDYDLTKQLKVEIVDKQHMPLVAFRLKPSLDILYTVFEIQDKLRERGYGGRKGGREGGREGRKESKRKYFYPHLYNRWIVPAYRCSKGAEKLCIMRVVRLLPEERREGGREGGREGEALTLN